MATTTEPTIIQKHDEDENESKPSAEDEDTGAQVAPIVQLQEVAVSTGEENEHVLLELKSKLYRFDKEGNQWKERGVGVVKLLRHKETGKVRLVMRQNKTLKICANHLVLPTINVQEHHGNEKSCVWHAADFADGELKEELFCIRFASVENCQSFKDKIEEIIEAVAKVNGEGEEAEAKVNEEGKEATAAAELIAKLSVEEKDKENKPEAQEASSPTSGVKKDDNETQEKSDDLK